MSWVISPGRHDLKKVYQELKALSKKCAHRADEKCWEAKAAESERRYEVAVSLGCGGSL